MPVFHVDNREAMRDIVPHLIEVHGVRDIFYLSGPKQNPESIERLRGVMDDLAHDGASLCSAAGPAMPSIKRETGDSQGG